jgi:endosialidase-like protein
MRRFLLASTLLCPFAAWGQSQAVGPVGVQTNVANIFTQSQTLGAATNFFGSATGSSNVTDFDAAAGTADLLKFYKGNIAAAGHFWDFGVSSDADNGFGAGDYLVLNAYSNGVFTNTLLEAQRASGSLGTGNPFFVVSGTFNYTKPRDSAPNGVVGNNEQFGNAGADAQHAIALGNNPVTTNSSNLVTLSATGCCAAGGPISVAHTTYVEFAGLTSVGGLSLNATWVPVTSIVDANDFVVTWPTSAGSSANGGGAAGTYTPNSSVTIDSGYNTLISGAPGFSLRFSDDITFSPAYFQTTGNMIGEHWYSQTIGPSDTSGLNSWQVNAEERDLVSRGADNGPCDVLSNCPNYMVGAYYDAWPGVEFSSDGLGTATNVQNAFAVALAYDVSTGTHQVGFYHGFMCDAGALAGVTQDPTSVGGDCLDVAGSYYPLGNNPYTTHASASNVTINFATNRALGQVSGTSTVKIVNAFSFDGVTVAAGTYTVSNVTSSTVDITGSGTGSTGTTGGGAGQYVYLENKVPRSPEVLKGEFAHGIQTASNFLSDTGYLIETQPGNGLSWYDGTGRASIQTTDLSAGNVSLALLSAGTGSLSLNGLGITSAGTITAPSVTSLTDAGTLAVTGLSSVSSLTASGLITTTEQAISGNVSASAWLTAGIALQGAASTYTDTSSSGAVGTEAIYGLSPSTLSTTNGATIANAVELYVPVPTCAGSLTCTGKESIVTTGVDNFNLGFNATGGADNLNASSNFNVNMATGTSTGTVSIGGTASIVSFGGGTINLANAAFTGGCTALTTASSTGKVGCTASDERLKIDNGSIDTVSALEDIMALPVAHRFHFKDGAGPGGEHQGFFAQDIRKVRPDLVSVGAPTPLTPDGTLQFSPAELTAELVQGMKAQQNEIERLWLALFGLGGVVMLLGAGQIVLWRRK